MAGDFTPFPVDISAARARGVLLIARSPITGLWTVRVPLAGFKHSARERHELYQPAREVLLRLNSSETV